LHRDHALDWPFILKPDVGRIDFSGKPHMEEQSDAVEVEGMAPRPVK